MKTIRDSKWIAAFLRRFCGVNPKRYDLTRLRVEVRGNSGRGLRLHICNDRQSLIELGWFLTSAWPVQSTRIGDELDYCDEEALSRSVGAFLRKHDLIDRNGRSSIEWEQQVEIVLSAIRALSEAVEAKEWSRARELWDALSPWVADNPEYAGVGPLLRRKEAAQVGSIH